MKSKTSANTYTNANADDFKEIEPTVNINEMIDKLLKL